MSERMDYFSAIWAKAILIVANAPFLRVLSILRTQHASSEMTHRLFKGGLDCFRHIRRQQGFLSLWRGTLPLLMSTCSWGVLTSYYQLFEQELEKDQEKDKDFLFRQLLKNIGSQFALILFAYPFQIISLNMRCDSFKNKKFRFKNFRECFRFIKQNNPLRSFYKIFWLAYFCPPDQVVSADDGGNLYSVVLMTALYPLIVMIERMQLQLTNNKKRPYGNLWQAMRTTFREEGIRGFYRGFSVLLVNMVYFKIVYFLLTSVQIEFKSQ